MSYLAPYKKSVVIAVAFMLLDVVCEVIQPTLMSNIVGFGIQSGDIPYIVGTGSLMILFALIAILAGFWECAPFRKSWRWLCSRTAARAV